VYLKIGGGDDGIYHDSKHDQSTINLRTAGIRVHHYFFNGGDPATAARYCASWLGGMIQPGERFGWDIESPAWSNNQEAVAIDTLASLGYGPHGTDHYGSSSTLHNYPSAAARGLDLWVAEYGSNNGYDHGVSTTGPWGSWRLHQYTSNGTLPGYAGRLDLSVDGGGVSSGTDQSGWGWINQTVLPLSQIQHAINADGYQPPLVEDNIPGPLTEAGIKWYQAKHGLDADGIVGPITAGAMFGSAQPSVNIGANLTSRDTAAIQQKLNEVIGAGLTVDGLFGPLTTAAVEKYQASVGITVDGLYGSVTDGHLFGGGVATSLVVDGIWGLLTTEAEQHALGVTPDGVRGPQTISAEQRRTGAGVDGIDGPDTRKHLQEYLNRVIGAGLVVDGIIGPLTVKALQTALNAGKF
jgi:peptidoglycan hydrolase-like protein with peptidoglycan-binding domain